MRTLSEISAVSVPDWNAIPPIRVTGPAARSASGDVILPTDGGDLLITPLSTGVRIRIGSQGPDYGILKKEVQPVTCTVASDQTSTQIQFSDWSVDVSHSPFAFELKRGTRRVQRTPSDGHFVRQHRLPPLAKLSEGWLFCLELDDNEPVYGLGEKWSRLDKRGQFIRSYNHDALGVNGEISYKNAPFAWSTNGWGVFAHTPSPVSHGVGFAPWSQRAYGLLVEDPGLDVFLFEGQDGAQLLDIYTGLTGKAPVPPAWSLGVILSKAYYRDVPELMDTAKEVRRHEMPCDVITLDGRAWQDTDTRFAFEWDPKRFDDPQQVVSDLKAMHFKVCVWEYPLVSVNHPLFDEMAEKGWLLTHKVTGEPYRYQWDQSAFGEVLTPLPESGIVDFTHPDAYAFWRDKHKGLFDLGVDMIKADFGEQVEDDNMLAHSGDSGKRLHNVYSLLYNRCVYEAASKFCKTGPFLFSRSAWAGSQCLPSQWGGDPQADWGGLAGSIRGALAWGMTGAPFYATDVGGFYKDTRDAELFVRWVQAAVFSAHMRLHGIGQREPWSYGEDAQRAADNALTLRYQLLPYIAETIQQASASALPVMRAMPLAFPEDRAAWAFEQQFMFGNDMLVVPCLKPGGDVEFYLPAGEWIQFPGNKRWQGGRVHTHSLSLDEIMVLVPSDVRIPLGDAVQHTEELSEGIVTKGYWPDMAVLTS